MSITPIVTELVTPAEYQETRCNVFQSQQSFEWFCRSHRNELIERGAMLMLTGRWLINPSKLDNYVIEAGQRRARIAGLRTRMPVAG